MTASSTKQEATLTRLFDELALKNERVAFRTKRGGAWENSSFAAWRSRSRSMAALLVELGVVPGDRIGVFGTTREEWIISDVAILYAGAVTVPVYGSLIGDQAAYILDHAEVKVLFAEDASYVLRVLDAAAESIARISHIVLFSGDASALPDDVATKCRTWKAALARAPKADDEKAIDLRLAAQEPGDLATIVYTSGTTGPPKGAMLTHGNFTFETTAVLAAVEISQEDEAILFLPMAHIFAKVLVAVQMRVGFPVAFAESVAKTLDNVAEINPTIFPSVPRLYEKIHAVASDKVAAAGGLTKTIFDWSLGVGKEAARVRANGEPMGMMLRLRYALAKRLVLDRIKARFGSRIRFAICGGAPLAEELCVWFHGAGIEIYEGYGLTETTAASNITHPGALRFGTVGRAMVGVDVKLAPDGEVLIRGGNVMKGYYKKPEETKAVMDEEGFFASGDIGVIDADGYLKITDRKKDILVTAGGKNVAPQNIENLLKQAPMVSQVVVLGDNKPYLVALVTLDPDAATRFAKEGGKSDDLSKLATDPDAIAKVQAEIDTVNAKLSQYETIKKFVILPKDFSIESGELTPTLKVKRKVVAERYQAEVAALYASGKT